MRLTAEITADILSRLVSLLSAFGNNVILHFSESFLSLCIPHDSTQVGVWVGCSIASCFSKYEVQSKSSNTVSMKLAPAELAQAIALDTSPSIQLYLSRSSDFVYLQLTHKSLDTLRQLEHRVPILLLVPNVIQQYAEPDWEPASMCARLPPLRAVISWCANARNIHNYVTLSLVRNADSGDTDMVLTAENEMVSVSTRFFDLRPRVDDADAARDIDCSVYIDLKKFLKVLKVSLLQPTVALVYVVDKKYVRLHFEVPANTTSSISMTYFLNSSSH